MSCSHSLKVSQLHRIPSVLPTEEEYVFSFLSVKLEKWALFCIIVVNFEYNTKICFKYILTASFLNWSKYSKQITWELMTLDDSIFASYLYTKEWKNNIQLFNRYRGLHISSKEWFTYKNMIFILACRLLLYNSTGQSLPLTMSV